MRSSPKPGDVLGGKYVLGERIGAGGMGVVFRAEHPALARRIAVKVLHPHLAAHAMYARRFGNEALAASRVRHRGTVSVLDFDVAIDGTPFIAMEFVPGRPLGQLLAEELIPLPRALAIFEKILRALDAVHACSVIHGDVKSDNFLIEEQAGGDVVTMIDFGLAQLDGAVADPGLLAGTPEYLAPEIIRGQPPTRASDLYGAGTILYELLTGTTPFAGGLVNEILRRQLVDVVLPPSLRRPEREIPTLLDQIVLRALAKDPSARFTSTQELRDALAAISLERVGSFDRRACPHASPDRHRIARGSSAGGAGPMELRCTIESATARGDLPRIAAGYVALAAALARESQLGAAICELEEGIEVLTAGHGASSTDDVDLVDQLTASLAALYELAGDTGRARRTLASTDGRTTLVDAMP